MQDLIFVPSKPKAAPDHGKVTLWNFQRPHWTRLTFDLISFYIRYLTTVPHPWWLLSPREHISLHEVWLLNPTSSSTRWKIVVLPTGQEERMSRSCAWVDLWKVRMEFTFLWTRNTNKNKTKKLVWPSLGYSQLTINFRMAQMITNCRKLTWRWFFDVSRSHAFSLGKI